MMIETVLKEIIRSAITTAVGLGGYGPFSYPTKGDLVISYPEDSRLAVVGILANISTKEVITLDGVHRSLEGQTIYRVPMTSELTERVRKIKKSIFFPVQAVTESTED